MQAEIATGSHTRLYNLFVEPRCPDRGLLELVVEYLARCARLNEDSARDRFDQLWQAAARTSPQSEDDSTNTGPAWSANTPPEQSETPVTAKAETQGGLERIDVLLGRARRAASPTEAQEIFEHLVSRNSAQALVAYAKWHFKRGNMEAAEHLLKRAGKRNVASRVLLGKVLEKSGKYPEALATYQEGVERNEPNADTHVRRVESFIAIESAAYTDFPLLPAQLLPEGVGLARAKKAPAAEAEEIYLNLISRGSNTALIAYGNWQFKRGDLAAAEQTLRRAVNSGVHNSRIVLGRILQRVEKYQEAVIAYQLAVQYGEVGATAHLERLQEEIHRSGVQTEAIEVSNEDSDPSVMTSAPPGASGLHDLERSLVVNHQNMAPEGVPARVRQSDQEGALIAKAKKATPEEAQEIFEHLIDMGSRTARIAHGNWHLKRGNLEEAENIFREAGDMRISHALIMLGKTLERGGKTAEARAAYEEAMRRGELNAAVNLAKLLEKQEDYAAAERMYLVNIRKGGLGYLSLGQLYEKIGKEEEAEQLYLAAIEENDGAAVGRLGQLYRRRENIEKEAELYENLLNRGLKSTPNNIPARLAAIRERQGRLEDALHFYRMAQAMNNADAQAKVAKLEEELMHGRGSVGPAD